jgi:hypothetical protein
MRLLLVATTQHFTAASVKRKLEMVFSSATSKTDVSPKQQKMNKGDNFATKWLRVIILARRTTYYIANFNQFSQVVFYICCRQNFWFNLNESSDTDAPTATTFVTKGHNSDNFFCV